MNSAGLVRLAAAAAAALSIVVVRPPQAVLAADDARQIVEEWQKRTDSKSHRYEGLLQVFESSGKKAEKRWTFERLGAHGRSKVVIRFTAPPEVKGVALLLVNHPDRASDQWMWTPSIERDRRVAFQDRSTRFFGTDFSFEDLEERDLDQFEYAIVAEEAIDGEPCWKVKWTPKEAKSSQYSHSFVWIRKDTYAFAQIESYVSGQLARKLSYSDFQNVQGIWTARELAMSDVRRGSITRLALNKIEYNLAMSEDRFTLQGIRQQ